MGKGGKRTRLTFPVTVTETHKGKALEVDCAQETIVLRDPDGNPLGSVTWHAVIEHIYAAAAQRPPEQMRVQPRTSLVAQVRYWTTGDQPTDSRATGIGGGGLFIESLTPLPVGTNLDLEFMLPDQPAQWLKARGAVVWVCPKADQYTFSPGMGIRFTKIADEARERVLALVASLQRKPPDA